MTQLSQFNASALRIGQSADALRDLTDALRFVKAERFLIDTIKEMRAAMLCPSSPQKVRAARIRCDELLAKLEGE